MHHNARNKIMYCILFRGGDLNRFKVLPDLGDQDHPGVHDPHTYSIWCPLTKETRIYMYLVYGWGSQPFSIFLIIFCFRGIRTTHGLMTYIPIDVPSRKEQEYTLFRNRIPIVFRDIWSFPIPGGCMTSGAIYYFP